MPKASKLETQAFYRGPGSKDKFEKCTLYMEWDDQCLQYREKVFWHKLFFNKVVSWEAKPGGYRGTFIDTRYPPSIILRTASGTGTEEMEFAIRHLEFDTWLYWIIRSLIKHSKAPMPVEQVNRSPLLQKHKARVITSLKVAEFNRAHDAFINTRNNLDSLLVRPTGKFIGEGKTHLDFSGLKKIGTPGASGTVILELQMLLDPLKIESTEAVAVKMLNTQRGYVDDDADLDYSIENMIHEARVLAAIGKHPNIVGLVDTAVFKNSLCLFLEKGSGDIKPRQDKPLDLTGDQVLKYAVGILAGINHMHQRRVYHLDMKPDNVIICQADTPKIIDFGLSKYRILGESKKDMFADVQWSGYGTKGYISPESWDQGAISKEDDLAKRDSYAVGMTIFNALLFPYCKWKEFDDSITGDTDSKNLSVKRIDHIIKLVRDEANRKKLIREGLLTLADAASGLIEKNREIRLTCGDALAFLKADRKQQRRQELTSNRNDVLTAQTEHNYLRGQIKKLRDTLKESGD